MMLLSIDPSVISLGWAVFETGQPSDFHTAHLIAFGTVERGNGSLPLEERIKAIITGLEEALHSMDFPFSRLDIAVIEKPQLWGAFKSVASAQSGALLSLHILVGALFWHCNARFFETHLVTVSEWKGQLPKEITKKRMEAKWDTVFKTDDESDAVGLGTYYIEEVLRKKGGK